MSVAPRPEGPRAQVQKTSRVHNDQGEDEDDQNEDDQNEDDQNEDDQIIEGGMDEYDYDTSDSGEDRGPQHKNNKQDSGPKRWTRVD
ncbi:hypothetical protein BGX31_007132 [Mortierella sp. GBA43]|nr:hypothetical protein BGX31_007132 [Mortierella sp. GBA43]